MMYYVPAMMSRPRNKKHEDANNWLKRNYFCNLIKLSEEQIKNEITLLLLQINENKKLKTYRTIDFKIEQGRDFEGFKAKLFNEYMEVRPFAEVYFYKVKGIKEFVICKGR